MRQLMLCIKNNKQHSKVSTKIKLHNKNKQNGSVFYYDASL